jgi:hypothetical protein
MKEICVLLMCKKLSFSRLDTFHLVEKNYTLSTHHIICFTSPEMKSNFTSSLQPVSMITTLEHSLISIGSDPKDIIEGPGLRLVKGTLVSFVSFISLLGIPASLFLSPVQLHCV